jgi:hypothetical protein
MDNQLNYQQAKSVRNRSIKDLIADELIRGKGLGGAIGGAIGLKSQARMKGIKEKFDPLNIVKFLTFGSRLGPALYGKLFGRSRKDIEYFTGRASPIGERKKKITGLSGQGEGEDTVGGGRWLAFLRSPPTNRLCALRRKLDEFIARSAAA